MQLITWTDEILSVGVAQFDNHHKAIVENLNQLYDAIIFNKGKLIIIPLLKKLKDFCAFHFEEEEALMSKYNYNQLEAHKKLHKDFYNELKEIIEHVETNENAIKIDTVIFLKNWFFDKIFYEDKMYSDFFNQNGIH